MPEAAQRVSATFTDLQQKLRVNTTQAFLVKTESSISKRMRETRGYLELVVDVAEKPADGCIPKVIVQLAEKALCIAKRWNKLQRKVKYWGSILSIFSKPLACQTYDMDSGIIYSLLILLQVFNSNICFICRDFSRRFSLLCNCHSRYAHSSIPH